MTKPKIICSKCGKLRQSAGKDICNWCYRRYFWKRKLITCPRCKRNLPHHAKGYCEGCYNYIFHLENTKSHNAKRRYNLSLETYRELTKECILCSFNKIVDLHHLDKNRKNNSQDNLVSLCPNHHKMIHILEYKDLLNETVERLMILKKLKSEIFIIHKKEEVSAKIIQEKLEGRTPLQCVEELTATDRHTNNNITLPILIKT